MHPVAQSLAPLPIIRSNGSRYTLLAGFLAAMAAAQPNPNTPVTFGDCGTSHVSEAYLAMVQNFSQGQVPTGSDNSPVNIDVYAHVVVGNKTETAFLNNETVRAQMRVLDETFAPSNTRFNLVDIDQTVNDTWSVVGLGSQEERTMKRQLRKGTYNDLNVYFLSQPKDETGVETGGWCPVPDDTNLPDTIVLDGWKTLTHEVGHWMGLRHPFQGGCAEEAGGDSVADTPAMSYDSEKPQECNDNLDTCPDKDGFDPVHNFMVYTSDDCRTHFTKGQMAIMRQFMDYRTSQAYYGPGGPGYPGPPEPETSPDSTKPGKGKPDPDPQPSQTVSFGPERTVYQTPEDEERERQWDSDDPELLKDILRQAEEVEQRRSNSSRSPD
ncbi:pregnancy-associated plasma protein-A domain-containing protein [Hirsutella rhossiliensis]|uniref:Pregnancy-associated plasma protein-A domain-containing protein n=1 Tax=Hirsutella rhossiliensis TaxID=111463 RepID=A0A9P8SEK9_9HYPO|nr:pregnancy-associated plasma protein-A domain-containing protein [Hirsutella rhossiliensis]KAH0958146.1 pregnancy-associated plasma protein-A domain-containing protein [Hirsutella rhossiliensis]